MSAVHAFANLAAYELWARDYPPVPHNALMRAEQAALLALWPDVAGARALDLASGSGRYALLLQQRGAASVVATDLSAAMLARSPVAARVRADMMELPFAAASFDVIASGLAVGHAPSLAGWLREAARVLAPGGTLLYSDFHPDAARAGMTRSFTDAARHRHELLHGLYDPADHRAAAAGAGLAVETLVELRVGRGADDPFGAAPEFQRRWQDLALVLCVRARKPA